MAAAVISLEDRGKRFVCQFCRERHTRGDVCGHAEVGSGLDRKLQNIRCKIKCAYHTPQYLHDCPAPRRNCATIFFLWEGSQDMIILEEERRKVKLK